MTLSEDCGDYDFFHLGFYCIAVGTISTVLYKVFSKYIASAITTTNMPIGSKFPPPSPKFDGLPDVIQVLP